jgi:hypothetical protein
MLVLAMEFSRGGPGTRYGSSRRAADPRAGFTDTVTLLGGATAALPENGTEVPGSTVPHSERQLHLQPVWRAEEPNS